MKAAILLLLLALSAWADTGTASWYGNELRGHKMANGQKFDPEALTAASWSYPLGTKVRVSAEGKTVDVTITDRGPAKRLGRVIDLSRAAFARLASPKRGTLTVNVQKL